MTIITLELLLNSTLYEFNKQNIKIYQDIIYRGQCFCGNFYGKYGAVSESDCSAPCSGDNLQMCGNAWINSVYATSFCRITKKH